MKQIIMCNRVAVSILSDKYVISLTPPVVYFNCYFCMLRHCKFCIFLLSCYYASLFLSYVEWAAGVGIFSIRLRVPFTWFVRPAHANTVI